MSDLMTLPLGKREITKAANRLAILDAARAVFGDLGYEAATVRDIIRRTGLASGTFYNYYRSKEELFEALSDDAARRLRPILRTQYETAPDFQSYIYGAVRAYFTFMQQEHETWQAKRPLGERQPAMHAETPEMTAIFSEVRDSIRAVIDRDEVRPVDADYLAGACIALARDIGEQMLNRRPVDIDSATEFAVQMILGGIPALPTLKS